MEEREGQVPKGAFMIAHQIYTHSVIRGTQSHNQQSYDQENSHTHSLYCGCWTNKLPLFLKCNHHYEYR